MAHWSKTFLGNVFNSCLDIDVDSNRKCSHFIDYMMSNFGHLYPESVVTLCTSYYCSFYG